MAESDAELSYIRKIDRLTRERDVAHKRLLDRMICPQCNHGFYPGDKACNHCGADLVEHREYLIIQGV